MKKGVFGAWFKELATLIFTQTIQAFLLAIVMTIVISALGASGATDTGSYAAGLLAIIALSQFNKIERLVKSIFGVQSQYGGDMDSGKGGLLAGAAAFTMGKKLLNNGGKMLGGATNAIKSGAQIRNLNKQKAALGADAAALDAEGAAATALNTMEGAADNFINNAATGAGMASGAQLVGGTGNNGMGTGVTASQIDQLIQAVNKQTQALDKNKSDSDKDKLSEKMKALDDKIQAAQQNKREAIRTATSGLAETLVAPVGAAAGTIVGLGMGDSNPLDKAVTGAGLADMAAAATVRGAGKVHDTAIELNDIRTDNQKIKVKINEANTRVSNANKDKAIYDSVTKQLNQASKNRNYMENSTSQQRARTVKKLEESVKKKYNASNM